MLVSGPGNSVPVCVSWLVETLFNMRRLHRSR